MAATPGFPSTYREFVRTFPDDAACAGFLERLRWPSGFVCPKCTHVSAQPWRQTRNRLVCPSCRRQASVTAGTLFDRTRTSLTTWFDAAWHVTTAKNGLSAKTLERTMGVRYRVAWTMLQRFRVAMVHSDREPLSGEVEVDETFVGGPKSGRKRGRGAAKSLVAIAVELKQPRGFGRVRMRYVLDASAASLVPFVRDVVRPGSLVVTDGWRAYSTLSDHGYAHKRDIQYTSSDPAHVSMPGVHRIASLFKRWILGTHQGSVTPDHLQSYLEEFTFRFNRRASRSRGLVFRRLLEQAIVTPPVTENDVSGGYQWQNHYR